MTTSSAQDLALPRSTPSSQGVAAAGISAFLDAVEQARLELHSLMVLRHGRVVAEGWWRPYSPGRVHLLYSLSKSFTSAALGFAVAEGLVDLDAPVLSYFPELDEEVTDRRSRSILVRHVASMASGHEHDMVDRCWQLDPENLVRAFLLQPPEREPGSLFTYNQPCTYSLAAIVQRVSGGTLTQYLTPRLFAPLGITEGGWQQRPPGQDLGFTGLHLTTDSVARFGQTLLDGGVYAGRRVLPEGWVERASAVAVPTAEGNPDWDLGYGRQFWRSRHGWRGDGAFGQFCLVLPEQDAVVVTTSATERMQTLLDAVWAHLLPAMRDEPTPDAEDGLAARLAALELPVPAVRADLAGAAGRFRARPDADDGGPQEVELAPQGDGWRLTSRVGDAVVSLDVAAGRWQVTEGPPGRAAGAAALGAPDADTLQVDVVLLETPHRLRLRCRRSTGELSTSWPTRPLGGLGLATMARPLTA